MKMSDLVAQTILEMLDDHNGNAEIQRNELATSCFLKFLKILDFF